MPLGKSRGDLAVEKVLADLLGVAQHRIAEPAGAGLFVNDQRIVRNGAGDLARQRVAPVADLDEIARCAARLAASETIGREGDAVGAQLQQRLGAQNPVAAPDTDAAAILPGAATVRNERII